MEVPSWGDPPGTCRFTWSQTWKAPCTLAGNCYESHPGVSSTRVSSPGDRRA